MTPNVDVVLLGTAAGPAWWRHSDRAGISTAVEVGDQVYLVDCGDGWGRRYRQAGLGPDGFNHGIDGLRTVLFTHLHSDHTTGYPNLLAWAWYNGQSKLARPIKVLGPGDRGVLPPVYGDPGREPEVAFPESPTPGTREMTDLFCRAMAADLNDRIRDNGKPPLSDVFEVTDIEIPPGVVADPNVDTAPSMDPFMVYQDELVTISAILVQHAPVFPAFAYRLDTPEGSVVISGDTGPCDNLLRLAEGVDVLVHEVIDEDWVSRQFRDDGTGQGQALAHHLVSAHTTIAQVGPIAESCGAKALVLSHLGPSDNPTERWDEAKAGFSGDFFVGQDLLRIPVAASRRAAGAQSCA
jgi:ribonuclease BN (tRNA processing enzyme)